MSAPVLQIDRIDSSDERFERAKRWEYQILGQENGYANDDDHAAGEMCHFRRWEQSSEFFVGFGDDEEPVGIMRVLRSDPQLGIDSFSTVSGPTQIDREWQAFFATVSPRRLAEVATQAVRAPHLETGVMEQLWNRVFDVLAVDGVRNVVVAPAEPLFERYRAVFGEAIEQFGETLPGHAGVGSVPAIVDLELVKPRT